MVSKTITVTVNGLTVADTELIIQEFLGWLSNSGEQEFWMATECDEESLPARNTTFKYYVVQDRYLPEFTIEQYESEDTD